MPIFQAKKSRSYFNIDNNCNQKKDFNCKLFFLVRMIDKNYWKIHSKITLIAYQISISIFSDELHLGGILEVLLVVRFEFLADKTCR